mmetsp:Transcript_47261/g.120573  ORF Transcript_47261/g.120573 Transcript_47261/m.120573 type:complete len:371 (-) Transcript_47261:355-1467(-)
MPLTRRRGSSTSGRILYVAFNQDDSCLCVGTREGVKIYSLETRSVCFSYPAGAISVAEMLFCTSLLAFVGAGEQSTLTPRRLRVMNTATQTPIRDLTFPASVLAAHMNRKRLVVVLENRCYIHHLDTLEILRVLETPPNQRGVVAVSPSSENCLLALPTSSSAGRITLYDMLIDGGGVVTEIPAHNSQLELMSFNRDGTMLASASVKGTVIRVHHMPQGSLLFSFRRGTYPATIYSFAFSAPGEEPELLAAASSNGSVHLFHLKEQERLSAAATASSIVTSMFAPKSLSDMVETPRSLGTVRTPCQNTPVLCALQHAPQPTPSTAQESRVTLIVASIDGVLYEYHVSVADLLTADAALTCSLEREDKLFG